MISARRLCLAVLVVLFASHCRPVTADSFGSLGHQFDIEFVTVGSPANAADATGNPNPVGSVASPYRIGTYEVSFDMIEKSNGLGGLGITLSPHTDTTKPATGITWNEAARFVNWLNTSEGFAPAYKFATQPGDVGYVANQDIALWTLDDSGFNSANPFRNSRAVYFLPSVDEWYKAAFFDPASENYYDYPTGSNVPPTAAAGGLAAGTAVYDNAPTSAPITSAGGRSPFGTMGQGGNVYEWEETSVDLLNSSGASSRGFRGGDWLSAASSLHASSRLGANPSAEFSDSVGFRVASVVPEPGAILLASVSAVALLRRKEARR